MTVCIHAHTSTIQAFQSREGAHELTIRIRSHRNIEIPLCRSDHSITQIRVAMRSGLRRSQPRLRFFLTSKRKQSTMSMARRGSRKEEEAGRATPPISSTQCLAALCLAVDTLGARGRARTLCTL